MATTNESSGMSPMLRFLLSGKFADFQIRSRQYYFNVHRNIISGASKYFESACGGNFSEARNRHVVLDEEPIFVAILILCLYQGTCEESDHLTIKKIMANAAMGDSTVTQAPDDIRDVLPHQLHITMFALGEYYAAPDIVSRAATEFESIVVSTPFTIQELMYSIDLVYGKRQTISDKLRAMLVYWAQQVQHELVDLPEFKKIFDSSPEFAHDFLFKYGRDNKLYCTTCCQYATLSDCDCGLRGLCGWKHCSTDEFGSWACKGCGKVGELVRREDIQKTDNEANTGKKLIGDSAHLINEAVFKMSPRRSRRIA